jgi:hypothetical protein
MKQAPRATAAQVGEVAVILPGQMAGDRVGHFGLVERTTDEKDFFHSGSMLPC